MPRYQEILPDMLPAIFPKFSGKVRLIDQLFYPVCGPFNTMSQNPVVLVLDLQWDTTDCRGNNRSGFPQCLGDGQAKALGEAFHTTTAATRCRA